jgi:hypothetical protein
MTRQAQQRVRLLLLEELQWKQMAAAVARLMWPAAEEN